MSKYAKTGLGGVFWICFIIFGILALAGLFYWMVIKPPTLPSSPPPKSSSYLRLTGAPPTQFI